MNEGAVNSLQRLENAVRQLRVRLAMGPELPSDERAAVIAVAAALTAGLATASREAA